MTFLLHSWSSLKCFINKNFGHNNFTFKGKKITSLLQIPCKPLVRYCILASLLLYRKWSVKCKMLRKFSRLSRLSFISVPVSKEPWSQKKFVLRIASVVLLRSYSKCNILVNPTRKGICKLYIVVYNPHRDSEDYLFPVSIDRLLLIGVRRSNIYMHLCFCMHQGTHHRTSIHIFYIFLSQNTPSTQPTCSRKRNMSYFICCSFTFAADVCFLSSKHNPYILLSSKYPM